MKVYQDWPGVAQAFLHAMQGQAWFLTPPFVVMALTDDDIPDATRQDIASALLEIPVPEAFTVGRPKFPDVHQHVKLADLVTEDSWFFFHVIGQEEDGSHRWLGANVQDWEELKEYKLFKAFIHKIDVGNDRAECRVKLIQEYIASAHSEGDLQDLL